MTETDAPDTQHDWRTSKIYVCRLLIWGAIFGLAPALGMYLLYQMSTTILPTQSSRPLGLLLGVIALVGYYVYLLYHVVLLAAKPGKISFRNDRISIKPAMALREVNAHTEDIERIVLGRDLGYDVISTISIRKTEPASIDVDIASNRVQAFVTAVTALNPSIEIVPYDKSHPGNIIMRRILRHW